MKYVVILCDGMADYPLHELNEKTPMEIAKKPNMDWLAGNGQIGLAQTVAKGFAPGSDVANLAVLGYSPKLYYAGRSPLEAASMGIDMGENDIAIRCNLVTLSNEKDFEDKTMLDYCAGDISTEKGHFLIQNLQNALGNNSFQFYPGISYRHCLIWKDGKKELGQLTPAHDIIHQPIAPHLPKHPNAAPLWRLMAAANEILRHHPINQKRIEQGLSPANGIWLWGNGVKKPLPSFYEKYTLKGSMISAVDLLKGIAMLSKMNVCEVKGATGYIDTNWSGKAAAAIQELKSGSDFVYVHIEAPDECGHRGEIENKVWAIEQIDSKIIKPLLEFLKKENDFKVMLLPDHATPLSKRTHTSDPVPYLFYSSKNQNKNDTVCFSEKSASLSSHKIEEGFTILQKWLDY